MPAGPLRRTLSAPAAHVNATPYPSIPRRSQRQHRRRVLGEIGWWTVVGGQDHAQLVPLDEEQASVPEVRVAPLAEAESETDDVTLFNIPSNSDNQMTLAPQPEYLAFELASLTLNPTLSIAPSTPPRPRSGHRETSLSPLPSNMSSVPASLAFSPLPLFSPDFDTPESTPQRNRTRRARTMQRTTSEPTPALRGVGSRRRHLERLSLSHSIQFRSSVHDENAPFIAPDLFN